MQQLVIFLIGTDGAKINPGNKGGVIHLLETSINKPVHWIICLLHANELPLKILFSHLDGKTEGPNVFSGLIGKQLNKCQNTSLANFKKINNPNFMIIEKEVMDELSSDQLYLYKIIRFIATKEEYNDIGLYSCGQLHNARWLTLANRICRLYISTEDPEENLQTMTKFIISYFTLHQAGSILSTTLLYTMVLKFFSEMCND